MGFGIKRLTKETCKATQKEGREKRGRVRDG
jgi:hypothetical protein